LDDEARSLRGPGTVGLSAGGESAGTSSNLANSRRCAATAIRFSGLGDWMATDGGVDGPARCKTTRIIHTATSPAQVCGQGHEMNPKIWTTP